MKKNLLFVAALFAGVAASAQTIVWPCTVDRATKATNLSATTEGGVSLKTSDITMGSDLAVQATDGGAAIVAVKDATGANYNYPDDTFGMIGWQPIKGNTAVDDVKQCQSADQAETAGCYIDFTVEEQDLSADLAGITTIDFYVTKVGTDGVRMNCKLLGEGDGEINSEWLINEENAYTFGDEYAGTEGGKDDPWDEAKTGYNPSRNDGSKGADTGANANGISHVTLTVPETVKALNPYKLTLRVVAIDCANNKQLGLYNVKMTSEGSTGISNIVAAGNVNAPAYNIAGQKVDESYKGVIIKNGKKMLQK